MPRVVRRIEERRSPGHLGRMFGVEADMGGEISSVDVFNVSQGDFLSRKSAHGKSKHSILTASYRINAPC